MARKGKMGGHNGANNKTNNWNNRNNQNNNSRNNQRNKNGKWCNQCKKVTHNTADCFISKTKISNTTTTNPWINQNSEIFTEHESKFKYCKFCKEFGHDLANCSVLSEELKSAGVGVMGDGISLPRNRLENTSKVLKGYVNPFDREKLKFNPFSDLVCTHSAHCRGLCGNEHYMAKTKLLKRHLQEVLDSMQLWLETLTPPEDDPNKMEWEFAPMIVIPRQALPADLTTQWYYPHLPQQPVIMMPNTISQSVLTTQQNCNFDRYLKGYVGTGAVAYTNAPVPQQQQQQQQQQPQPQPQSLPAPAPAPVPAPVPARHVRFAPLPSSPFSGSSLESNI